MRRIGPDIGGPGCEATVLSYAHDSMFTPRPDSTMHPMTTISLRSTTRCLIALSAVLALFGGGARAQSNLQDSEGRAAGAMDAPFITTANEIVNAMLDLAGVVATDTVFDLGCGDGRIVIAAARDRGARGVGIEIDPVLVESARVAARQAGVAGRVRIEQGDLFTLDLREASVVMLYLGEDLNTSLWPKLARELNPGTRVVSHRFIIRGVPPERIVDAYGVQLYLWTIKSTGARR